MQSRPAFFTLLTGILMSAPLATLPTASAQVAAPSPDALLAKAQHGDLTLSDLIERLGSPNLATRRQAALTVLALRDHYVAGAQAVVAHRYAGKAGPLAAVNALETLALLRVTDPAILRDAARHVGFNWTPPPSNSMFSTPLRPHTTFPAAQVLVRAGFAALPTLADAIATAPLPTLDKPTRGDAISLACAYAILGPATADWLESEAATAPAPRRAALEAAARFVAAPEAAAQDEESPQNQLPVWLSGLELEQVFDESYGYSDRAPVPLNTYQIRWNAALALGDEKTMSQDRALPGFAHETLPASTVARFEIARTMRLLAINISERLPSYSSHSSNDYAPFPPVAQTDAVRLLGALRLLSQSAAWKMWEQLHHVSFTRAVDEDTSQDMRDTLRALGQIGTPAGMLLMGRIAHQSGPNSQRAAAYGMGKVWGRYARDYLNTEILRLQRAREAHGQPLQADSYESSYIATLQIGQEKQWFEGQYYGANDPHAYEPRFPSAAANDSGAP